MNRSRVYLLVPKSITISNKEKSAQCGPPSITNNWTHPKLPPLRLYLLLA